MADNSPTFQRWDLNHPWVQVPKGRLTVRMVSRPFGTYCPWASAPNVETLGYYRESLRDTDLPDVLDQRINRFMVSRLLQPSGDLLPRNPFVGVIKSG